MTPEIPSVKVLSSINPANSGTGEEVLTYNDLISTVERYEHTNPQRARAVWDSKPGSLDELSKARQLASEYLLRNSVAVITCWDESRDLWADRFTQAGSELYGAPEREEVTRLLTQEYTFLGQLNGKNGVSQQLLQPLLATYKPLVEPQLGQPSLELQAAQEDEKQALEQYGQAMTAKYQPLFTMVDAAGKEEFTPNDLEDLFKQALKWLEGNDNSSWSEWQVELNDATSMSIKPASKKIMIASRREAASITDTKGLIAHELLVHALRGNNGHILGGKFGIGLPGYLDAEEGLGVLAETAINGELPDKVYDRYVDIGLAIGIVGNAQLTRQQLFKISYARQAIRAELQGNNSAINSLVPRVWNHIDRIYRGGPGDDVDARQAIFTKDISYYVGYKQMAGYIAQHLADGKTAAEVFEYLSQAKIDPTNPQHVEELAKAQQAA